VTDLLKNYYVTYETENGLRQISVAHLQSGNSHRIPFPEAAYVSTPYINREYDTTQFRYSYQSFVTPQSVYEYDMASGASTLLKQKEVPGGYDRTRYRVEQLYAPAGDGARVPISVVYRKGKKLDGAGPVYLYE